MSFEKQEFDDRIEYSTEFGTAVFGFERLNENLLEKNFPHLEFFKLQQIHSDKLTAASKTLIPADAHYTTLKNRAPLVQTADCLPVIVIGRNIVLSIHAGWRGVEQNIISKSLSSLTSYRFTGAQAFIGPFIAKSSFEVGVDVADRLETCFENAGGNPELRPVVHSHKDPEKKYVDLEPIARQQIQQAVPGLPVEVVGLDTFSDSRFHSFRRNRTKGRQWSFGFLK